MNVMKTSLTIIFMCPRERFLSYKSLFRLVLCYKKDWAILLHLIYFYCLLLVTNYLITKYLLPIILVLAKNTLLTDNYLLLHLNCLSFPSAPRWVWHTYSSKGLWLINYNCGSSRLFSGAIVREWSAFGRWNLVRKHLYSVLKFTITCYNGK